MPAGCYGAKTLGNKFYVRTETLRLLLVFCKGPFWYTQQFYFQHTFRLYITHGTETIMTLYDSGRTEFSFGPSDVCIWVSPFSSGTPQSKVPLTSAHSVAYLPGH
jgi:hypothetical protein